jgi:hypothetical protein
MTESYDKFFKYLYFLAVFIIATVLMFHKRLEILGWGIGLTISMITYIFLFLDVSSSPKSQDYVVFVIYLTILAQLLSNIMFSMTLKNLHHEYSARGHPIQLNEKYKKKFQDYKILFVTEYFIVGTIAFLFFTLYVSSAGNMPFFNTHMTQDNFYLIIPSLFFKVILCLAALGISGYMIFASYKFQKLKGKIRYVKPNTLTYDPSSFSVGGDTDSPFSIFQNLNLNYLMNYRTDLGL